MDNISEEEEGIEKIREMFRRVGEETASKSKSWRKKFKEGLKRANS